MAGTFIGTDAGEVLRGTRFADTMDAKGGGTEADGSLSQEYCSHCYQNGQFTMPNMTMTEMQSAVEGKLKEMGILVVL